MTTPLTTVVWLRLDLRLADNPALHLAAERGGPVVPLFIWSPEEEGVWQPGAATRWWLHHSLAELSERFAKLGSPLIIRRGAALEVLQSVVRATGADAVYWNRRYEPELIARDKLVKAALVADGLQVQSFNSALLREPWTIATKQGKPYQVFTPFWRACVASANEAPEREQEPVDAPRQLASPSHLPKSDTLTSLGLLPKLSWADEFPKFARPGELHALKRLQEFLADGVLEYDHERDRPDHLGVSRLSPHLHFGELGPRQIREALQLYAHAGDARRKKAAEGFLRQIYWREFAHHLLYHFPHTPEQPLRDEFARFPWLKNYKQLSAWQQGRTGYPIVDAGMRQLWRTGWMHNRVRMIVASFLVKDLLLPWHEGARWFWDTLVDADLANNTLGWQWTAGCGADAAPYFRVFNPTSQGEKFDPVGDYVRRYVPELAKLPAKWIHRPAEAPREVLEAAGVTLGETYPSPLVDHAEAREAALAALQTLRK
ncbi:MAG: deoxyribodipyrimidine photolyase [Pirellula sp.]|nr:deoxyribodipyrimidine photolyase [Pirellula sp.]